MVLSVLKETLRLEFLNNCGPFCFCFRFDFYVFVSFVRVILFKIFTSYLLLCNICCVVSLSSTLAFFSHKHVHQLQARNTKLS